MTRSDPITLLFALLLLASLGASLFLWMELQALQQQMAALDERAIEVERLEAVEAQAAATESRLTGLLLSAGLGVEEVANQLAALSEASIRLTVPIDEEIPIDLVVPFSSELEVPIQMEIPIITTIEIPIDLGPFGTNSFRVPINTTVPIDLTVPVSLDTEVPINTTLPISLDVPVTLPLGDSAFGAQLDAWQEALRAFSGQLVPPEERE